VESPVQDVTADNTFDLLRDPYPLFAQKRREAGVFEGSVKVRDGKIYPSIKGRAFVNSEADLIFDPHDPFCMGIRP